MTIKTRIRHARKSMNMTLTELATLCETSVANVSRWEREPSRVNLTTLYDLARALRMKPHELLLDSPDDDAPPEQVVDTIAPLLRTDAPLVLARHHLKQLTNKPAHELRCMMVRDDAMQPTLQRGDWVLLELCHAVETPGLYVGGDMARPQVRRIVPGMGGRLDVLTDNPVYRAQLDINPETFPVIGKVIWVTKNV